MKKAIIQLLLIMGGFATADELPINQNVNQLNISKTICTSSYTRLIRPSSGITNKIKKQMMIDAGLNPLKAWQYELDHIIPLAIGGHQNHSSNFMLQLWDDEEAGAKKKDKLEVRLQCLVCTGAIELRPAQEAIYGDWQAAYIAYMGIPCKR
jgi:hypothetical protein